MSSRHYDCLYAFNRFSFDTLGQKRALSVISYCRRPSNNQYYSSDNQTCHGISWTFDRLRTKNITGDDLHRWNAPIDLIDQYMSGYEDKTKSTIYCNCTTIEPQTFGRHCEYSFPNNNPNNAFDFDTIIDQQFDAEREAFDETADGNITCLEGFKECDSIQCLDWRQICNGIPECLNGEDEIGYMALELNTCDEKNDEQSMWLVFKDCFKTASMNCDEFQCGWLAFPCGDGHCLDYFIPTLSSHCIDWNSEILHSIPQWICFRTTCRYVSHNFGLMDNSLNWLVFLTIIDVSIPEGFSSLLLSDVGKNNSFYRCQTSNQVIPKYRVMDSVDDCFGNDDESYNTTWEYINTDEVDYFRCHDEKRRIPRRLFLNEENDCSDRSDRSDEPFILPCLDVDDFGCKYLRYVDLAQAQSTLTVYQDLCDDIARRITPDINGETDESNCQNWPCDSRTKICNGMWNCMDGRDELNCPGTIGDFLTRNLSHCADNEHYCWNLVSDTTNKRNVSLAFGCIPYNRAGDGFIDCYGSTTISHVKNICPWMSEDDNEYKWPLRCRFGFSACKAGDCIATTKRCNNKIDCHPDGEDEWFCDIIEKRVYRPFTFQDFDLYPNSLTFSTQMTLASTIQPAWHYLRDDHYWTFNFPWWYCNRGIYVHLKNNFTRIVCLCPPSFYGDRCQFQHQRITLYLRLLTHALFEKNSLLRLFCYFLGEDQNSNIHVLDFEEIVYNPYNQSAQKYIAYLTRHTTFTSLAVRIDVYQVKEHEVTYYQSSWYFNISFSFLPVNRLVQELIIRDDTRTCSSSSASKCIHGTCRLYINIDKSYCQCYDGWVGDWCETKVKEECHVCASSAQCVVFSRHIKPCVCPVARIGRTCHVKFDTCLNIQCKNNGTCLPIDERALSCTCVCSDDHFGDRCQFNKSIINIQNSIPSEDAAIVHFVETRQGSLGFLTLIERHLFPKGFLHPTRIVLTRRLYLPTFIFVRTFTDANNFYGNYYLTPFVGDREVAFLDTSIVPENCCPHVDELLQNRTLSQLSHLARFKYYHNLCLQEYVIRCFHDEMYICLCDQRKRTDCLIFDHSANNCSTDRQIACQNQALCLQTLNDNIWNFHCVCQKCYYGNLCQFTTLHYTVSLDALIGTQILRSIPLRLQPNFVLWSLVLVLIMLIIGSISNLLSITIFFRHQPREFASGVYLLMISLTAQTGIIVFVAKYISMIVNQMSARENHVWAWINCFVLEILASTLPTIYDWLTACLAIDRSMTATQGTPYNKKRNQRLAKYINILTFVIVTGTSIHKSIARRLIDDLISIEHTWCVLAGNSLLMRYESIINVVHLIGPFAVNLTSTFFFLTSLARRKTDTTAKQQNAKSNYRSNLLKQMVLYRPFVVSPIIIALFSLPRLIFTFAFTCIQTTWQKDIFLAGYFISFVPLTSILFIFVLPSPAYKTELYKIISWLKSKCS